MSSKVKVVCPNGHKFTVNPEKNLNRDHKFCPVCKAKVTIRKKHFFSPSPTWDNEKKEMKAIKAEIRSAREPTPVFPTSEEHAFRLGSMQGVLSALAFSKLIKKREEEKKLEKRRQDGTV